MKRRENNPLAFGRDGPVTTNTRMNTKARDAEKRVLARFKHARNGYEKMKKSTAINESESCILSFLHS